jgi:putative oxidoreductase
MSTPVNPVEIGYRWVIQIGRSLQSPLLLLIRLCWGIQFFQTGLGKLMHIQKVIDFFTSIPIPFPAMNAYLVGCTEMIGGALLTIGFASRLTAIPLSFTLIIAYLTTEQTALKKLFSFSDINPFLTADPFLFLFACLVILAFGPGIFSVDYLIERSRRKTAVAVDPAGLPS